MCNFLRPNLGGTGGNGNVRKSEHVSCNALKGDQATKRSEHNITCLKLLKCINLNDILDDFC